MLAVDARSNCPMARAIFPVRLVLVRMFWLFAPCGCLVCSSNSALEKMSLEDAAATRAFSSCSLASSFLLLAVLLFGLLGSDVLVVVASLAPSPFSSLLERVNSPSSSFLSNPNVFLFSK